jgi:phosphate transport system substrate-binding protein
MKKLAYGALGLAALAGATLGAMAVQINGAGATFPAPIYAKWFSEYNKLHPDVQINYQPLGSGAGIRQVTERTVFFGATDGPMTPDQLLAAPGKLLHLPTVLGAVVPIYNVPGLSQELKFDGPALANIFLGKITKWNDAAITALNPGVNLPGTDIVVAHRSDGSGTTYIWVDYLSKVSPEFKKVVGVGTAVKWPVGVAAARTTASRRSSARRRVRSIRREADLRSRRSGLRPGEEHEREAGQRPHRVCDGWQRRSR